MSGDQPPPPGWQPPPPEQQPLWGQPAGAPSGQAPYPSPQGPAQYQQPYPGPPPTYAYPGGMPVAHKPGAIPLRPLVLSDIFDGAFRIIRYNPRATIGAAVLVSAVAMIVPIVAGLASGSTGGLSPDAGGDSLSASPLPSR